ncbi:MAG: hypothetical protein HY688_01870 [Chloroflexi bacterium]|nr:hypothetical protein [Chloroflexota bacterium]
MSAILPDTLGTLRRLAMRQMEPAELAEWLAVRFPDLWDSALEADRYVLSELSLALESVDREEPNPQTLAEHAVRIAQEVGVSGINSPTQRAVIISLGSADSTWRVADSDQPTVIFQAALA